MASSQPGQSWTNRLRNSPLANNVWLRRGLLVIGAVSVAVAAGAGAGLAVGKATGPQSSGGDGGSGGSSSGATAATTRALLSLAQDLPCCVPLGANMQLRYANPAGPQAQDLEYALVGALPDRAWMSFGPADPRATNRLMVRRRVGFGVIGGT
jgi:hypothetical protein